MDVLTDGIRDVLGESGEDTLGGTLGHFQTDPTNTTTTTCQTCQRHL